MQHGARPEENRRVVRATVCSSITKVTTDEELLVSLTLASKLRNNSHRPTLSAYRAIQTVTSTLQSRSICVNQYKNETVSETQLTGSEHVLGWRHCQYEADLLACGQSADKWLPHETFFVHEAVERYSICM